MTCKFDLLECFYVICKGTIGFLFATVFQGIISLSIRETTVDFIYLQINTSCVFQVAACRCNWQNHKWKGVDDSSKKFENRLKMAVIWNSILEIYRFIEMFSCNM